MCSGMCGATWIHNISMICQCTPCEEVGRVGIVDILQSLVGLGGMHVVTISTCTHVIIELFVSWWMSIASVIATWWNTCRFTQCTYLHIVHGLSGKHTHTHPHTHVLSIEVAQDQFIGFDDLSRLWLTDVDIVSMYAGEHRWHYTKLSGFVVVCISSHLAHVHMSLCKDVFLVILNIAKRLRFGGKHAGSPYVGNTHVGTSCMVWAHTHTHFRTHTCQ